MRFTLNITCDNAAFGEDDPEDVGAGMVTGAMRYEIARILRTLARNYAEDGETCPAADDCSTLMDINGNKVGKAEFSE